MADKTKYCDIDKISQSKNGMTIYHLIRITDLQARGRRDYHLIEIL